MRHHSKTEEGGGTQRYGVVKGQLWDAELGVDICDNKFCHEGSSVPPDGERSLISYALKKSEAASQLETWGTKKRLSGETGIGVASYSVILTLFHEPPLRMEVDSTVKKFASPLPSRQSMRLQTSERADIADGPGDSRSKVSPPIARLVSENPLRKPWIFVEGEDPTKDHYHQLTDKEWVKWRNEDPESFDDRYELCEEGPAMYKKRSSGRTWLHIPLFLFSGPPSPV